MTSLDLAVLQHYKNWRSLVLLEFCTAAGISVFKCMCIYLSFQKSLGLRVYPGPLCVYVVFLRQVSLLCPCFELANQESVSNQKLNEYCIDDIPLQNYLLRQPCTSAACFPLGGN